MNKKSIFLAKKKVSDFYTFYIYTEIIKNDTLAL